MVDIPQERGMVTADERYGDLAKDRCRFPLFGWLHPLGSDGMVVLYSMLFLSKIFVVTLCPRRFTTTCSFLICRCMWNSIWVLISTELFHIHCGILVFLSVNKRIVEQSFLSLWIVRVFIVVD